MGLFDKFKKKKKEEISTKNKYNILETKSTLKPIKKQKIKNIENPKKELLKSINERRRPEDVAHIIFLLLKEKLNSKEKFIINRAVQNSLYSNPYGYTSMKQDFFKPVGTEKQVKKVYDIFKDIKQMNKKDYNNPEKVKELLKIINNKIHKDLHRNDFKDDRLNKKERELENLDLSKRQYNKLFRLVKRLEEKLNKFTKEKQKVRFQKIGKSALASELNKKLIEDDLETACFIAYYTARLNLRTRFTIYGQTKPYDDIAEMLFNRCLKNKNTNWYAIAHIFPDKQVLDNLTNNQKGELLGKWFSIMQEIAILLEETWSSSNINRETMVVKKGNDSSTWNNTANAWNKARDHWISLLYSLGMDKVLETICPGKVLRLVAGDLQYWHTREGEKEHEDNAIWRKLPLPWEVMSGKETCNLNKIVNICKKYNVDPYKTGWIIPRKHKSVPFAPTPELVHGVEVYNPYLAKQLRKMKWFSGKL